MPEVTLNLTGTQGGLPALRMLIKEGIEAVRRNADKTSEVAEEDEMRERAVKIGERLLTSISEVEGI